MGPHLLARELMKEKSGETNERKLNTESYLVQHMYVFFIRTKYMYNEENTPLCKWNEQQKVNATVLQAD